MGRGQGGVRGAMTRGAARGRAVGAALARGKGGMSKSERQTYMKKYQTLDRKRRDIDKKLEDTTLTRRERESLTSQSRQFNDQQRKLWQQGMGLG